MAKPLSILFVSSEVYPFAKTGGLADVSYSLPLALRELGHDIRVMMPKYGSISERKNRIHEINRLRDFAIMVGDVESIATVKSSAITTSRSKVQAYITTNQNYFEANKGFYSDPITGIDYPDNDERFIFFNRTVLQTCILLGWFPDIIHCNDWQTGLVPAIARTDYAEEFKNAKIIYTIHNFGNQGSFPASSLMKTGLTSPEDIAKITHNDRLNFMKAGIAYSDQITTVSPTYCAEILRNEQSSNGLNEVLRSRGDDMLGILDGVDLLTWNPKIDPFIAKNYDNLSVQDKIYSKEALLHRFGLPMRSNTPLIGMISRLNEQKGVRLIIEAAEQLFAENLQFVLLGEGDPALEAGLQEITERYPEKASIKIGFDDELAHLIEAGSDMFMMPSLYEPCGLNQQYSLVYGTVPIVRSTGGLADTVREFNPQKADGNGFVFQNFDAQEMVSAVRRALAMYSRQDVWSMVVQNGMTEDLSWSRSAKQYSELYHNLMQIEI
ncbi:MAG: glycogen synthase GlgA [Bacteroidetes bacterium]|nr:glycogen synthase GlgA [Bacteroidota bacterium]